MNRMNVMSAGVDEGRTYRAIKVTLQEANTTYADVNTFRAKN
jgi:hypothetical protein